MMIPTVEKAAITAIVCGAMLFVRGLIPGLLGAFSPSKGPIHNIQTDMRLYGDMRWSSAGE